MAIWYNVRHEDKAAFHRDVRAVGVRQVNAHRHAPPGVPRHRLLAPRGEEEDGLDYHFKTKERFEELIRENAFIEYAKVHDNYYGTLKAPIEEVLAEGNSMILDIDVQGAAKVRDYVRALPNNDPLKIGYVDIFLLPPDMEELRRRLVNRGTDAPDVIERRLANAEGEIARADEYMFKVTNDDLGHAYKRLCDLIDALSGRM